MNSIKATLQYVPDMKKYDYNTTTLCIMNELPLKDISFHNNSFTTYGNPTISNVDNPINTASLYFDGSSTIYTNRRVPHQNDLYFTFEFYFKYSGNLNSKYIFSKLTNNYGYFCGCQSNKFGFFVRSGSSTSYSWTMQSNIVPSDNTWHHIAICRNLDYCYIFIDGVNTYTNQFDWRTALPLYTPANVFVIGGSYYNTPMFTGYINNFRISDICRYTENFTPPTQPFSPYLEG